VGAAITVIRPHAVALVGATATGKSALGEALARALDAEVVCCDSRQVFAELELGTGKPSPAERAAWPHHLFDALRLGEHASAGWFARAAGEACAAVRQRGRLPLLVGGSGLYLRALREGLAPTPPHDPDLRRRLRAELDQLGPEALHARLAAIDPRTAGRLSPRDRQRIGRALEVHELTGQPLSWWHERTPAAPADAPWAVLEIVVDPAELRQRIARRTTWMFSHGLVEEARALVDSGAREVLRALRAIGYDEAMDVIDRRLDRAAAEARVNLRTARLAKRQRTWFRHQGEALRLEATGLEPEPLERAAIERLRGAGLTVE
jgi:tRNA dimethylallyltransferase